MGRVVNSVRGNLATACCSGGRLPPDWWWSLVVVSGGDRRELVCLAFVLRQSGRVSVT